MITIVALGNPGEEYAQTRHNVGWIVARELVERNNLPSLLRSSKFNAELSEGVLHGKEVSVLLPATYMNNSGASVKRYLEGKQSELVVIHDEVDLPFGAVKISKDRGAGGHNGVRSIIDAVGTTNFVRIRVGICQTGFFGAMKRPKGEKLPKFVLGEFKPGELRKMPEIVEKVEEALQLYMEKGIEKAMQEVNA